MLSNATFYSRSRINSLRNRRTNSVYLVHLHVGSRVVTIQFFEEKMTQRRTPRAMVVTPANARVQERWKNLDSGLRRNDRISAFAFYFVPV